MRPGFHRSGDFDLDLSLELTRRLTHDFGVSVWEVDGSASNVAFYLKVPETTRRFARRAGMVERNRSHMTSVQEHCGHVRHHLQDLRVALENRRAGHDPLTFARTEPSFSS